MAYIVPDTELVKYLTEDMRKTLTDLWIKGKKAQRILQMEESISRQQAQLDALKSVKAEEKP